MDRDERRRIYAKSLKRLCARKKSVSEVAREIGINRQQFEIYLQGISLPSANNRFRISQYFGVPSEDFFETEAIDRLLSSQERLTTGTLDPGGLFGPTSEYELRRLRNYQGIYHAFFVTPAFPEYIHVGAALIREQDHRMTSVFFVRSRDPDTNIVYRSHLYGLLFLRGERVFIIESSKRAHDRFSETILYPTHGDKMKYMTGMSIGLTWHPKSEPYASRTIWRRANPSVDLRQAMRGCGLFRPSSTEIDPMVRNFFGDDDELFHTNSLSASGATKNEAKAVRA